jgi:ectoine hydroxylase-related dioxygenase (phytanoyl-CoA dioxygenase family)
VAVPIGSSSGADSLSRDGRLLELASSLLGGGGPVACFGITFVVKAAGDDASAALWHQDGYPWESDLGITSAVTLWMALDPVGPDNGGLAVIPGSHSLPAQPLGPGGTAPGGGRSVRSLFGGGIGPAFVDESLAVPLVMGPGDVSAHHPHLIHGSPANTSASVRRALVLRYASGPGSASASCGSASST